jgi:hypothetical protein
MALVIKKPLGILAILLILGLGTGCDLSSGGNDSVYSYNLDEMERGIFNSSSHTMTLNRWFQQTRWWDPNTSYDIWSQREGSYFYREKELKTRFAGSDMVSEDTVIYCDFIYTSWQGKKIGDITGTITLTGIFSPTPKVWIGKKESTYWQFTGKVNMSEVTGTESTLNWSMPVYELSYKPPMESRFGLFVLPNGSKSDYGFEVPIPTVKTINNANMNVGNLGTVSIKGVAVSGTLTVTYNGNPVPYVELFMIREAGSVIQEAYFFSPGPETPWSVILESVSYQRSVVFQVFGYSKENPTGSDILFDIYADNSALSVTNQNKSGIVLNLGDIIRN